MNQRGFGLLAYLLAGIAILSAIGGLVWWADQNIETSAGKRSGEASKQVEWDAANLRAAQQAEKDRLAREAEAKKVVAAQQETERKAREYETKWRQARAALRTPLAIQDCSPALTGASTATAEATPRPDGLRLTYGFLRLYDGAWTGAKGVPLLGDPGKPAESAPEAGAASARGLGELLETHASNAEACSANARQLGALIGLIRKLQAQ